MASKPGTSRKSSEKSASKCLFCNGSHEPGSCQLFQSIDAYVFGYRKMRAMMLLATAKNDLLLYKGCKKSKEYFDFRDKKLQELRSMKAKLQRDREKLKAFMKAANDLQQCLNIPAANIQQMYTLLAHPNVSAYQQRAPEDGEGDQVNEKPEDPSWDQTLKDLQTSHTEPPKKRILTSSKPLG